MFGVVIADDHELFRDGLAALLTSQRTFSVFAQVSDGPSAVAAVEDFQPDLLVLDVEMGEWPVDRTIRSVRRSVPSLCVAVLTMHADRILRDQTLRAGADAFLTKDMPGRELFQELTKALDRSTPRSLSEPERGILSPREREVLLALGQAMSNKQIALWLSISEGTVKRHTGNIYEKLGARSRIDAVRKAKILGVL